jgi:hypothetical protein
MNKKLQEDIKKIGDKMKKHAPDTLESKNLITFMKTIFTKRESQ